MALWAGPAALAAIAAVVFIAVPKGENGPPAAGPSVSSSSEVISGAGMHLELPRGWRGRIRFGGTGGVPILEAMNFELPNEVGADGGDRIQAKLGPDHVLLTIVRQVGTVAQGNALEASLRPTPPRLDPEDIGRSPGAVAPASARIAVVLAGERYDIDAAFGTENPSPEQLDRVNELLGRFRVAVRESTLTDGRYFGYIRWLGRAAGGHTYMVFDAADLLGGPGAVAAARMDGAIGPNEPLSNDYYIRNPENDGARSAAVIDVVDRAPVTRVDCSRGCLMNARGDLNALTESFGREESSSLLSEYRGSATQYDISIVDGMVASIDERYLP